MEGHNGVRLGKVGKTLPHEGRGDRGGGTGHGS